jgi:hypothetical protein
VSAVRHGTGTEVRYQRRGRGRLGTAEHDAQILGGRSPGCAGAAAGDVTDGRCHAGAVAGRVALGSIGAELVDG